VVLRDLIIQNQSASVDMDPMAADARQKLADLIKFGAIIFSSAPILMLYPFLQRFFVKGVMIGAVKG
jgi:putative aldouronate transport system permease protein